MSSNALKLILKKKWFDLIASGEKKEEYRSLNWYVRIVHFIGRGSLTKPNHDLFVEFRNGYRKDSPRYVCEFLGFFIRLSTDKAVHPEWGEPEGKTHYVIKLGKEVKWNDKCKKGESDETF